VDFHPENLVIAGPHPVVVDCETLLHPATSLPEYARAEDDSILRTGMLTLIKRIPHGIFGRAGEGERLLDELAGGFIAMHQFMRRGSSRQYLQRWVDRLCMIPARRIYRPTAHYLGMLNQSLAPSLLADGLERSLYLHACCCDGLNPTRRVSAEVAALQNADVPAFSRPPSGIKFDLSEKTLEQSISMIRSAFEPHQGHQVQR
jgi:lantibiotic modifying enzyme